MIMNVNVRYLLEIIVDKIRTGIYKFAVLLFFSPRSRIFSESVLSKFANRK